MSAGPTADPAPAARPARLRPPLTLTQVRNRFWVLAGLRWLPVGLLLPVMMLLPLQRGLTVAQLGAALATQGIVVLLLELPTGGLADALGRRPVILASAVFAIVALGLVAVAQTPLAFAVAFGVMGVFRALDSGPLNAWFVDAVHASPASAENDAETRSATVARGLSGAGVVCGAGIAAGALVAGGVVAWAPTGAAGALDLVVYVAIGTTVGQLVAAALLVREDRPRERGAFVSSVLGTPRTIRAGVLLLRRSRVLAALVAVELFWGFGMVAFESLMPVRAAELVGGPDAAAALLGPVTAAGWGVAALGAALVAPLLRLGSIRTVSLVLRLVQGATVVGMGLVGGVVGLVAAYLLTYAVHESSGVLYETLLHEQVDNEHRATVLSLASMVGQPSASLGLVVLGAVATGASTGAAMVVGGVVLALAAPLFLVRERAALPQP
ncbi:MFS transporter [Sanguibacter hominis ATCC BAA-789]|uniref:MFS transporter n=1 Tax=Sanguibacter hominis ATCC BAA-789 TaxID=1312740 RepID=A0A9X5IQN9_9MICO|nr:MFS transporter [Sanguibacter hominis]NKX92119.1 MFS transporter [Sanguibacter hominis ATCC BAA-789]